MSIKGRCIVIGTMEVDGDQMDGLFIEVPMSILRNSENLLYCNVEVTAAGTMRKRDLQQPTAAG